MYGDIPVRRRFSLDLISIYIDTNKTFREGRRDKRLLVHNRRLESILRFSL